jgi:ribosomal protein S8
MAIKWISYIWDYTDYRDGSALVALALADFANEEGRCHPKMETVAKKARLSVRQVQRIIRVFEQDGFIEIIRHYGRGKEPEFLLKKMTSVSPFADRKKVTSVTLKGDICNKEKVTSVTTPPTPPYKENRLNGPSMNREETRAGARQAEKPKPNTAAPKTNPKENITVSIYREHFPKANLTPSQLDLLRKKEVDVPVWRHTLGLWVGNSHDPTKLGNLFDRYERELKRKPAENQPSVITTSSDIDRMETEALERAGLA